MRRVRSLRWGWVKDLRVFHYRILLINKELICCLIISFFAEFGCVLGLFSKEFALNGEWIFPSVLNIIVAALSIGSCSTSIFSMVCVLGDWTCEVLWMLGVSLLDWDIRVSNLFWHLMVLMSKVLGSLIPFMCLGILSIYLSGWF